jgi:hypothetical protein
MFSFQKSRADGNFIGWFNRLGNFYIGMTIFKKGNKPHQFGIIFERVRFLNHSGKKFKIGFIPIQFRHILPIAK